MKILRFFERLLYFVINTALTLVLILSMVYLIRTGQLKNIYCNLSQDFPNVYEGLNCNNALNFGTILQKPENQSSANEVSNRSTVAQNALPGVVTVIGTQRESFDQIIRNGGIVKTSIGSGFVIRKDGWIATNAHVIDNNDFEYKVILNTDSTPAYVTEIKSDSAKDIAFIKINRTNLTPLKLGDSNKIRLGDNVIAIGSPEGERNTITYGNIDSLNLTVNVPNSKKIMSGIIQSSAHIAPGNSGGPLLNQNGEVVGVNFAAEVQDTSAALAIPINIVKTGLGEI